MKNRTKLFLQNTILFIILSLFYTVIYSHNGEFVIYKQSDEPFHFARAMSLENIWQSPINFKFFNQIAHPVNIFYPWLTIWPFFKIIQIFNYDLISSFYLFIFVTTVITLFITYYVAMKIIKRNNIAIVISVVYTFSLARTINFYYRSALGEAIAMTFFPLVLLGLYYILYDNQEEKWYLLTIGMTLITYTHILSLLMGAFLVAFCCLMTIIHRKMSLRKFIALAKATGMTLLMSLGLFIPMLQYEITNPVTSPKVYDLAFRAYSINNLFKRSLLNNIFEENILGTVILLLLFVVIVKLILLIIKREKCNNFYFDLGIASVFFTILATKLFPWKYFQNILTPIQFPWRFLVISTLTISFVSVIFIMQNLNPRVNTIIAYILVIAIVALHVISLQNSGAINSKTEINTTKHFLQKAIGRDFGGSDDYRPKTSVGEQSVHIDNNEVKIGDNWQSPTKSTATASALEIIVDNTSEDKMIQLPVYYWPGAQATLNNKKVIPKMSEYGTIEVPLTKGKNIYRISYKHTKLAIVTYLISLVAMISFVIYLIYIQIIKRIEL